MQFVLFVGCNFYFSFQTVVYVLKKRSYNTMENYKVALNTHGMDIWR